jgi:hypothetical protein
MNQRCLRPRSRRYCSPPRPRFPQHRLRTYRNRTWPPRPQHCCRPLPRLRSARLPDLLHCRFLPHPRRPKDERHRQHPPPRSFPHSPCPRSLLLPRFLRSPSRHSNHLQLPSLRPQRPRPARWYCRRRERMSPEGTKAAMQPDDVKSKSQARRPSGHAKSLPLMRMHERGRSDRFFYLPGLQHDARQATSTGRVPSPRRTERIRHLTYTARISPALCLDARHERPPRIVKR